MKKTLCAFMAIAATQAQATQNLPTFEEIYLNMTSNKTNIASKGKLILDLALADIGLDGGIQQKSVHSYDIDSATGLLTISIPTGQYYIDNEGSKFGDHNYCEDGLATSGLEVRDYLGSSSIKNTVVKIENSCGSMGCSFWLTFDTINNLIELCGFTKESD